MRYVLQNDIALKSWTDYPFTYVIIDGSGTAPCILTPGQFDFLCACDGQHEIDNDAMVRYFTIRGVIQPAMNGETTAPWQRESYPNAFHAAVNWEITSRCNLNCIHCFAAADNKRKTAEFSLDEARRFLDEAQHAGILGFRITGGEPMVHPDFFTILEEITARHMQVLQLETNGMFLTEENLDHLQHINPHMQLRVSYDGIGIHDIMHRHPGCEAIVLDALSRCKAHGFPLLVHMNVNSLNRDTLYDSILRVADLGVDIIRAIRTFESPRMLENGNHFSISLEDYFDLIIECAGRYKDSGRRATLMAWQTCMIVPRTHSFRCAAVKGACASFSEDAYQCPFTERRLVSVASNGAVLPCHPIEGLCEANGYEFDNAKTGCFSDILNRKKRYYKTIGEAFAINETCRTCKYAKNCRGGCPALGRLYSGYFGGPDLTKCLMLKGGYYEKLCAAMSGWNNQLPRED